MPVLRDRLRAAWEPLRVALCFGLLAGAARVLHYLVMRLTAGQLLWLSDEVTYLAPFGHGMFFVLAALPLAALAFVRPSLIPRRVWTVLFATMALYSFLLLFPRVHHLASLALALGGGIQIGRLLARAPRRETILTRLSGAIAAASVIAAIAIPIANRSSEARTIRALPKASSDAPNVLLVILDATRAQNMSVYGYAHRTTPNIERLGAEGVVFDRAISTAPWTLPSVASMMTGYYPTSLSTDWLTPLDDRFPVLAERLQTRGYLTGAFSANLNYATRETGLSRGFSRFMDVRLNATEMLLTVTLVQSDLVREARRALYARDVVGLIRALVTFHWSRSTSTPTHDPKSSADLAAQFLDWQLEARGRPWFGMLQMVDAHAPVKPKAPFDTLFSASGVTAGYDGAIATMDRDIGALLAELGRRGALSQTIVIVTADHGELFGEHGLLEHGNSLYMPVIHVPLIIRAPGRAPPGVHVRQPVSLRDLGATVLELVDRVASDEPELGGRSLRSTWDSSASYRPSAVVSALTAMEWRRAGDSMHWRLTSLVADSMHYIRDSKGAELLFNVLRDPDEGTSLTKTPLGRAHADSMRLQLESALKPER